MIHTAHLIGLHGLVISRLSPCHHAPQLHQSTTMLTSMFTWTLNNEVDSDADADVDADVSVDVEVNVHVDVDVDVVVNFTTLTLKLIRSISAFLCSALRGRPTKVDSPCLK